MKGSKFFFEKQKKTFETMKIDIKSKQKYEDRQADKNSENGHRTTVLF